MQAQRHLYQYMSYSMVCGTAKGEDGKERVMYKDDETRRVLYEVLLEQCFKKMSEEEKAKWICKESE